MARASDERAAPDAAVVPAGTLYVVATPIGNLGDVTLRALETLRAVSLVAAEDTRITRRLFARYEIATRLVSFHARSGPNRLGQLLTHLRSGADLGLVTDAGTPGVSDPGEDLVGAWAAEGGRVVPIPGASAVLAAVAASAIVGPRWGFDGFLPRSGRERKQRLARIAADDRATILFEAPTRLAGTLRDLAAACGADRAAEVGRELTKLHEQVARGTLGQLATAVGEGGIPARGEVVLVIEGRRDTGDGDDTEAQDAADARPGRAIDDARVMVERLVSDGMGRAEAARHVAASTGLPRRQLYRVPDEG